MELTKIDTLLLLGTFALLFAFFFAWFFEKIFQWDRATGKLREKLDAQWHILKSILVGIPLLIITYLSFGFNWYAFWVFIFMASLNYAPFNWFLNMLRNAAPNHLGDNPLDKIGWGFQIFFIGLSIFMLFILY